MGLNVLGVRDYLLDHSGDEWNLKKQHPLLELPWGLLALCRRTLGSERHWSSIAWFDEFRTDPMAVDGICGRRRVKLVESRE